MPKIKNQEEITPTGSYLGIDPGKQGGIALLTEGKIPQLWPMPETEFDIWKLIKQIEEDNKIEYAMVEWIHPAIQGIGKSPMSKLYGNYTQLRMACIASGISWSVIKPKKWQSSLGVSSRKKTENTTQWKDRLRGIAQNLYPKLDDWNRPLYHQRAICDALLISHHCMQTYEK